MRKTVISAIALAGVTPLFLVGTASQANAATSCYSWSCDGLVAASTTCVSDAYVAEWANIYEYGTIIGYIELKYSPSCRSTWARVISDLGYGSFAEVQSNYSSDISKSCFGSGPAGTGCNTDMIGDAGTTSYAIGTVGDSAGNPFTAATASY